MSKKRKDEFDQLDFPVVLEGVSNEAAEPAPVEVVRKPKIPVAHWIDKAVKKGLIREHQEEALLVFFGKKGLKNLEAEDSYNQAFKKF